VWIVHYAIHRDPRIWGESADEFDPSRFLPENEAKLPENAWRPFEKGARNCIGQELALLEARIVLAVTVRSFDFRPALDSLDELANDGSYYSRIKTMREGPQVLEGEEMYPLLIGTAKPVSHLYLHCSVLKYMLIPRLVERRHACKSSPSSALMRWRFCFYYRASRY